jgi:plastocyanin
MRTLRWRFAVVLLIGSSLAWSSNARAQARRNSRPATQADIERLEKKIVEQQKLIDKLIKLQQEYMQALNALFDKTAASPPSTPPPEPVAEPSKPERTKVEPKPAAVKAEPPARPKKPKPEGAGIVVGKISGAEDAIVYVDDIGGSARGSATMKQEGKEFVPKVLVVRKGTTVGFPNLDAFFHNVFSVSPGSSFDLGSYPQGETRTVRMSKPGVVTVYCNMHPKMVGYILVVPNGHYVRAGKDGFFRIPNVPAGSRRIVAWAPNAKPTVAQANVVDGEVVTVELALKKGRAARHNRKDGLPYGSYDK